MDEQSTSGTFSGRIQSQCKICGAPARYSYYGSVACQSCKVFFRRNAQPSQKQLKCHFTDDCVVDTTNRHVCSACRLKKCFSSGMCVEMIRATRPKKNKKSFGIPNNDQKSEQIQTFNLLRSDPSALKVEQWNLLSNIIHCYDEYSSRSLIESYFQVQNALPPKARHRYLPVKNLMISIFSNIQLLSEKNRDFLSLSSICRSNILRATVQYNGSVGGVFVSRQYHLFDNELLYQSAELIFQAKSVAKITWTMNQLDSDETFIKLILAILSFSTTYSISHVQPIVTDLNDVKTILSVQNIYVELTWKYLLYKYDHHEAVIRFSNIIRCLIFITNIVVEANDYQPFVQLTDDVIEKLEQTLHLQDNVSA